MCKLSIVVNTTQALSRALQSTPISDGDVVIRKPTTVQLNGNTIGQTWVVHPGQGNPYLIPRQHTRERRCLVRRIGLNNADRLLVTAADGGLLNAVSVAHRCDWVLFAALSGLKDCTTHGAVFWGKQLGELRTPANWARGYLLMLLKNIIGLPPALAAGETRTSCRTQCT